MFFTFDVRNIERKNARAQRHTHDSASQKNEEVSTRNVIVKIKIRKRIKRKLNKAEDLI